MQPAMCMSPTGPTTRCARSRGMAPSARWSVKKGVSGIVLGPLPTSLSQLTDVSFDAGGKLVVRSENALLKVPFDK